jgi:hypothetical protein
MHTDDDTPTEVPEEVPELDDYDPEEIDNNPIFISGAS